MRVIVIGAGVLGAAVAAGLTRRGADVTVLEAGRPGGGTTTTSFAWINANNKDPLPYFELNQAGVAAHHALAGGAAPWFVPTGNLEWATTDQHAELLAARVAKLRDRDYPLRQLTHEQALDLEPDLVAPADAELLERFVQAKDSVAFEMLIARHGPMVLGSARRLVDESHDAEDVFQAVFLSLARLAKSIRKGQTLPAWLHKATCRIAGSGSRTSTSNACARAMWRTARNTGRSRCSIPVGTSGRRSRRNFCREPRSRAPDAVRHEVVHR